MSLLTSLLTPISSDGLSERAIWGYQDFLAGVITSTSVTLAANSNGTSVSFDPAKLINSSASLFRQDGISYAFTGTTSLFSSKVTVVSQVGSAITLSGIPHASWGTLRIWYQIKSNGYPQDYTNPPLTVQDTVIGALGALFEEEENKAVNFTVLNDVLYPSIQAVNTELHLKLALAGGTMTGNLVMSGGAINEANEITLASASSVAIGAAVSNNIAISGTTTITSFDTIAAGIRRSCRATGAFEITYNATSLITAERVNIFCLAGDTFEMLSLGSGNWQMLNYNSTKPAFSSLTDAATIAVDLSVSKNFNLDLSGNRTLDIPTKITLGQEGVIIIRQDSTGSRTLAYSWAYIFPQLLAPILTLGKGSMDLLAFKVLSNSTATVTMTIATPCVVTWAAHGLVSGQRVAFTTTGALPTGLSVNTAYYINVVNANTFNLSTSLANYQAAIYIATTGSQSGVHTANDMAIEISINANSGA